MRRVRKQDATKVWHNPELNTFSRLGGGNGGVARTADAPEDRRSAKQHRAALEALFAPKREPEPEEKPQRSAPSAGHRQAARAGASCPAPPPSADPRTAERQKLLGKLLHAEGRPGISRAADEFIKAGFTFPEEQDVYLQLLEHGREDHVCTAIDVLARILAGELPKRRAVLESRLRRIEQFAEEPSTRAAAERLRRRVNGRAEAPLFAPVVDGGSAEAKRDAAPSPLRWWLRPAKRRPLPPNPRPHLPPRNDRERPGHPQPRRVRGRAPRAAQGSRAAHGEPRLRRLHGLRALRCLHLLQGEQGARPVPLLRGLAAPDRLHPLPRVARSAPLQPLRRLRSLRRVELPRQEP